MVALFRRRISKSAMRTPVRRLRCRNHRRVEPSSVSVSSSYSSASLTDTPLDNSPVSVSSSSSYSSATPSECYHHSPVSSSCSSETNPASSPSDSVSCSKRSISPSRSITSPEPSFLHSNLETEYYIPVAPLPIFRGDSNECPFIHMSRFDHACQANNVILTSMAARIFPASLDSIAALWYDSFIDPSKTWEEIRADFLSSFRLPISKSRSKLSSLRQSNEETINHYYLKLQFILNCWPDHNLSDETLKSIFIDGLKQELKDWVLPQGPVMLDEAFKLAISWEQEEEIREARETALKRVIKCGFCGLEGHEEGACEVRKKMRMLWARSSFKGSFVKGEGKEGREEGINGRFGKSVSLNRQCSCPKHQCWKKIERNESMKNEQEEFYDAAEE